MMTHPLRSDHRLALLAVAATLASLLAACGGGGSSSPRTAAVSTLTADAPPAYDTLANFTVAGTDLDAGVTVSATGCAAPGVLSGGTSSTVKVSCTPSRDGDIAVSVAAAGGSVLKTATFSVPKPQVRMTTSLGSLLVELEPAKAPVTVKNLLAYAQDGY